MEAVKLVSEAVAALPPSKYAYVCAEATHRYIHHKPLTHETKSTVRKTGYPD